MTDEEPFETDLDAYRDRVSQPLLRLFHAYAPGERWWLVLGLVTSVLAYGTVLVTPLVLGTTIDAVFTGESEYALPLVPGAWLPTESTAQFWLSATVGGGALLGGALLQWVRDVAMNYFAHGVMFAIRTDAYEKLQRLDMTFFETGRRARSSPSSTTTPTTSRFSSTTRWATASGSASSSSASRERWCTRTRSSRSSRSGRCRCSSGSRGGSCA